MRNAARPSKSGALARREDARRRDRSAGTIVEERVRPAEPAPPPAERLRGAKNKKAERRRCGRIRRQRPGGGALVDATQRRAKNLIEYLVPGRAFNPDADEGVDEADNRYTGAESGIRNR